MADGDKLVGDWICRYWYPSNEKPGTEEFTEYNGEFIMKDNQLVFESRPNAENSYMFIRMTADGDLVTGNWHENTSPTGEFAGAIYSGVFQALIDETGKTIEGKWTGIGQENGKRQIYTGRWQFVRQGA